MPGFQLNAMRPIIIITVLRSARVLRDAYETFRRYGIEGMALDTKRIDAYVNESLMLVTALCPVIGYDEASAIAHRTNDEENRFARRRDASRGCTWVSRRDGPPD
ncbi:MAG: hypothetical protein ACXWQR_07490 [Ktedonobacterales bacterium]